MTKNTQVGTENKVPTLFFYPAGVESHGFYVSLQRTTANNMVMNPTIDTYRLTSMEEPSDAVLSQLMREAAEDARRTNDEATNRFFEQMQKDAQKISSVW